MKEEKPHFCRSTGSATTAHDDEDGDGDGEKGRKDQSICGQKLCGGGGGNGGDAVCGRTNRSDLFSHWCCVFTIADSHSNLFLPSPSLTPKCFTGNWTPHSGAQ